MKEVIILAKGMTNKFCPFDCEVWGVNNVHEDFPDKRIDKLYSFDEVSKELTDSQKKRAPVVSWRKYADEKYPLKEIIKEFKTYYFPNSICYMIAHAIYLGYERIKLYGIDQPLGSPWFEDRLGEEYWLGRAQERGIELVIPEESELLKTVTGRIYGANKHNTVGLWLFERAAILGLMPQEGNVGTMRVSTCLTWKLGFTPYEVKKHKIAMTPKGTEADGNQTISFGCASEEVKDYFLTQVECGLIKTRLMELADKGQLPQLYLVLYEKFIRT